MGNGTLFFGAPFQFETMKAIVASQLFPREASSEQQ